MSANTASAKGYQISDPPVAQQLFGNTRWAWIWLALRLYLGYTWLSSGIGKLSNPAWLSGQALKGFWTNAVAIPAAPARPAITFEWYRSFIESLLNSGSYVWFAKLVLAGELFVGAALILGAFTGVAATIGGFMNWNFMMAGTASSNPLLFLIAILLILAWKVAGWWGLDRFLLPAVGTPWQPGKAFQSKQPGGPVS